MNKIKDVWDIATNSVSDALNKDAIFRDLLLKLNVRVMDVVNAYINYDANIFTYDNSIYAGLPIKFVHYLHMKNKNTWHYAKQGIITKFIHQHNPNSIIELGFGFIGDYVTLLPSNTKITFLDAYEDSIVFGKIQVKVDPKLANKKIDFIQGKIEKYSQGCNHDCIIALDCIEHTENPHKTMQKLVNTSKQGTKWLICLPIGPLVPVHTITWSSEAEIVKWLESCGLQNVQVESVLTANKEGDIITDVLGYEFSECLVRADTPQ